MLSCFSIKESEFFVLNNVRFVLGLSIVSDNIEKGLSFVEFSFRISLVSIVFFFLEN